MSTTPKPTRPGTARPGARKSAPANAMQPTIAVEDPLVGRVFGERYRILRRLGQGGMGAVYEAHHIGLERSCAVKVLPDLMAGDADSVQRFFREARATAQLNHPSVVGIYDVGWEGRQPYIAMELIAGRALDTVLALEKPLAVSYVMDVAVQAASGLAAAHEKGIVHRDVKPANLMITEAGVVKVLDFGLARLLEGGGQISRSGMVVGTLQFMSPEQASAEAVDERTDIYSLGATIYTLIAGVPPFDAPSAPALLLRTVQDEATELGQLRPGLRPEIGAVVRRMMAKRPDRRYPSMTACLADLERAARGQAPLAGMSRVQAVASQLRGQARRLGAAVLFVGVALAVARWSGSPGGGSTPETPGSGSDAQSIDRGAEDQAFQALEVLVGSDGEPAPTLRAVDAFLQTFPHASAERQRFAFEWKLRLDKQVGGGSETQPDPLVRAAQLAYTELGAKLDVAAGAHRYAEAIAIADAFLAAHGSSAQAEAMRARRAEVLRLQGEPHAGASVMARALEDALARGELDLALAAHGKLVALDPERARSLGDRVVALLRSDFQQAVRNGRRTGVERLLPALAALDPDTHAVAASWLAKRDVQVELHAKLEAAIGRSDYDACVGLLEEYRASGAPADAIAKFEEEVSTLGAASAVPRAEQELARAATGRDLAALEAALARLAKVAPVRGHAQAIAYASLIAELRAADAAAAAARVRPALEALHRDLVQAIQADWTEGGKAFVRSRQLLDAAGPELAIEVAEYRGHVELLAALRSDLAAAVAAAGLDGRDAAEVFVGRFAGGRVHAVRDEAIILAMNGAQLPIPINQLTPLELYRLGRLAAWKAPLTGLAATALLVYNGHRFEARGVAARTKLESADLGPALRRMLGAEFPSGSLERSWQRRKNLRGLDEGSVYRLVANDLERGVDTHAGLFTFDPTGAVGEGVLFPRVMDATGIEARWIVPALRHPLDESRVSILVRFERLDEDRRPVELRYVEIALRLDTAAFEVMRRDPASGGQMLDVMRRDPGTGQLTNLARPEIIPGCVPGNGGEVRLGVRLNAKAQVLEVTGAVGGSALASATYDFAERQLAGFGVASIGHACRLELIELRRDR